MGALASLPTKAAGSQLLSSPVPPVPLALLSPLPSAHLHHLHHYTCRLTDPAITHTHFGVRIVAPDLYFFQSSFATTGMKTGEFPLTVASIHAAYL